MEGYIAALRMKPNDLPSCMMQFASLGMTRYVQKCLSWYTEQLHSVLLSVYQIRLNLWSVAIKRLWGSTEPIPARFTLEVKRKINGYWSLAHYPFPGIFDDWTTMALTASVSTYLVSDRLNTHAQHLDCIRPIEGILLFQGSGFY